VRVINNSTRNRSDLSPGERVMARQHRQIPDTAEAALDLFWMSKAIAGNVPDYSGFMSWVAEKENEAKSEAMLPLHAMPTHNAMLELPLQLLNSMPRD
jgi:hypothetical protein